MNSCCKINMNMYALQLLFRKRNTILLSGEKVANNKSEIITKKTPLKHRQIT